MGLIKRKSFKINLKMRTKRKHTDYSLDTKYKSIQDIVKGVKSRTQIVNELGVPKSTVARWIKDKDKIFRSYQSSKFEPERKRTRTAQHEDLEEAVHKWFINARAHNLPVSGPFLHTQAQKMAKQLGYSVYFALFCMILYLKCLRFQKISIKHNLLYCK